MKLPQDGGGKLLRGSRLSASILIDSEQVVARIDLGNGSGGIGANNTDHLAGDLLKLALSRGYLRWIRGSHSKTKLVPFGNDALYEPRIGRCGRRVDEERRSGLVLAQCNQDAWGIPRV